MEVFVDTLINVYHMREPREVGTRSPYINEEHPGSNKKIEGWKWDKRTWPTTREFNAAAFAPTIWDPSLAIEQDYFQSGYGSNADLLLLSIEDVQASGSHVWAPKIHHGHFYVYDEEWILFSDSYQQEYFTADHVISGQQYLDMKYDYKPGRPLQVRRYNFNTHLGRHFVEDDFRKKVEFTESGTDLEFKVDFDYSPPRIWLNGEYNTAIGGPVTTVSGVPDAADILALELVGISDGTPEQQFYLNYSPVDPSQELELWVWKGAASTAEQWDLISGVAPFVSSGLHAKIDRDHGILTFGDFDEVTGEGAGKIPGSGYLIGMHYTKSLTLNYEPFFGCNHILAKSADVNPVAGSTRQGFVQILTQSADPAIISLEAELGTNSLGEYLIDLGNNTGRLIATVRDSAQGVLEGEEVTFEILPPTVGSFGAALSIISALTNSNGEARTVYNAPTTIEDVGQPTTDIVAGSGTTVIEVEGITHPGTVSGLYLYKIHEWDPPLGIPEDRLDEYYDGFFAEEGITEGATATQAWEEEHRTIHELYKPTTYDSVSDLKTGKKTIIVAQGRGDVINPHTGNFDTGAWAPLYATTVESIGTQDIPALRMIYSGVELSEIGLPAGDRTKAYFVVGDAKTRIRAYVTNKRTKKRIYSNVIGVRVTVPEAVNGTYFTDLLSNVPSGLLNKTSNVDNLTDEQVNSTSGVDPYWDDYMEERIKLVYTQPDHILYVRAKASQTGYGDQPTLKVSLRNGSLPAFAERSIVLNNTEFQTFSWHLTDAEILQIGQYSYSGPTDYDALRITVDKDPSTQSSDAIVSWLQLYIGQAPGAGLGQQRMQPVYTRTYGDWVPANGSMHTKIDGLTYNDLDYLTSRTWWYGTSNPMQFNLTDSNDPRGAYDGYEPYSFWFRRTRRGDTRGMLLANLVPQIGLEGVNIDAGALTSPGEIPMGFRLKSTGITLASVLDQITYLDPNDNLPSGYFGV